MSADLFFTYYICLFQLDQGGTIFSDRSFYLGNDSSSYHDGYTQYLIDVVVLLGGRKAYATEMAENMWNFEKGLAEVSVLDLHLSGA